MLQWLLVQLNDPKLGHNSKHYQLGKKIYDSLLKWQLLRECMGAYQGAKNLGNRSIEKAVGCLQNRMKIQKEGLYDAKAFLKSTACFICKSNFGTREDMIAHFQE